MLYDMINANAECSGTRDAWEKRYKETVRKRCKTDEKKRNDSACVLDVSGRRVCCMRGYLSLIHIYLGAGEIGSRGYFNLRGKKHEADHHDTKRKEQRHRTAPRFFAPDDAASLSWRAGMFHPG